MAIRSSLRVPWIALFMTTTAAALVAGCGEEGSAPPVAVDAGNTPKDTGVVNDVALVDLVTPEDRGEPVDVVAPEDRARIDAGMGEDRVTVTDRGVVDDRAADTGAPGDRGATDTGVTTDRGAVGDVAMADTGVSVGPYPAGPYGIREGDVLRDLEWEGYVNLTGGVISTMQPYGRTNLQAMRETGRRYAIVHVSEFY